MNDSILNIIINTVKRGGGDREAVSGLKALSSGFKELTGFSLSSATALGVAGMAAGKLVQFLKDSVIETEKYVTSVTDQARVVGMDVEEMSRLIQVTDDVFISQEKLEKSMLAATRRGIDVSREGLKKLSEEYLALDPKMERGYLLMQTFGRSGADMGKLMELGAEGIDAAMDSVSKSLLVTDQSMRQIVQYKQSIDNLNDAWLGVKLTVGTEIIPVLTALINTTNDNLDDTQELTDAQAIFNAVGLDTSKMIEIVGRAMGKSAEEIEELKTKLDDVNNGLGAVGSTSTSLAGDVGLVTQYFKDLTAEMIFNRLAASMDKDAQLELARQMGLVNEQTYFMINSLDDLNVKYDTNGDGVISLSEKTGQYDQELARLIEKQNLLQDKTVTYTIYTNQITKGGPVTGSGQVLNLNNGARVEAYADGGSVQANVPILVGEEGYELFVPNQNGTIIPNNALGGTVNNYFYGISVDEVMRRLALQGVK